MDSTPLMQVIWQTSSHLKLGRKVSRWLRLLCVLIVGIGLLLLVAALRLKSNEFDPYITNYSTNSLTLSQVFKRILLAFGSVCIVVGFLMGTMIRSSITCIFDKTSGNLTIEYSPTNIVNQPLSEILDVVVETWEDTYRVNLLLAAGKKLPLTYIYSSGERDKQKLVDHIRKFLGLVCTSQPSQESD